VIRTQLADNALGAASQWDKRSAF